MLQVLIPGGGVGAWIFVVMNFVCCQVRISAMGRSQIQLDLQSVCFGVNAHTLVSLYHI